MVRNFPLDFLGWVRNFRNLRNSPPQKNPCTKPPPPVYATPQAQSTVHHDLAIMSRTKEPSTLTPFRRDRERHIGTEASNGLSHCNGTEKAMKAM